MRAAQFFVAGGGLSATVGGIAGAAAFLSAGGVFGLAGVMFADFRAGVAIILGWSFGFLLLAVLIAPYFRKSGAFGVADFLAIRFESSVVRLVAALIVVAALVPALAAALAVGALVIGQLFALSPAAARTLMVLLVLSGTLLGGMRALTLVALAQYIVLAIALLAPAAILSTLTYSLPIPQLAGGLAWQDALRLAASGDLAAPVASRFLPFTPHNAFELVAATIAVAAGVAALPHLLMRQATVVRAPTTRRSVGWSLVFVLVVALTAPAYAAFARLACCATWSARPSTTCPTGCSTSAETAWR